VNNIVSNLHTSMCATDNFLLNDSFKPELLRTDFESEQQTLNKKIFNQNSLNDGFILSTKCTNSPNERSIGLCDDAINTQELASLTQQWEDAPSPTTKLLKNLSISDTSKNTLSPSLKFSSSNSIHKPTQEAFQPLTISPIKEEFTIQRNQSNIIFRQDVSPYRISDIEKSPLIEENYDSQQSLKLSPHMINF
jgi:hypothetical protein